MGRRSRKPRHKRGIDTDLLHVTIMDEGKGLTSLCDWFRDSTFTTFVGVVVFWAANMWMTVMKTMSTGAFAELSIGWSSM